MDFNRAWYAEDVGVIEHQWTGRVPGEFVGIPVTAGRSLSACGPPGELKDGRMSWESVGLEGNAIRRAAHPARSGWSDGHLRYEISRLVHAAHFTSHIGGFLGMYLHTPGCRQLARGLRIALIIGLVGTTLAAPLNSHAAQTLTLSAGAQSRGGDVQVNAFAPNEITINVGDTLTWRLDSTEFHNVLFTNGEPAPEFVQAGPDGVFLNPVVALPAGGSTFDGTGPAGSGLLNKGDTYSLTFTKEGVFPYLCAIHPGMGGVVNVVAAGQPADTQAAADARSTAQINADLAERAIPAIMSNIGQLPTSGDTIGIAAGVQDGPVDVQRFLPQRVTIRTGDAITWIWKTADVPHTVTFLGGEAAPEVIVPHPQPEGPPRLELSPRVLAPAGDPTNWDGADYLNSGFLAPRPGGPAPTFTVHFTSPGTYEYLCLLHEGMRGTVVVKQSDMETAAGLEEPGEEG